MEVLSCVNCRNYNFSEDCCGIDEDAFLFETGADISCCEFELLEESGGVDED